MLQYKLKNGLNKIKNNTNIKEIIKEKSVPSWKNGIENKTYKDTFDNRRKQNNSACYAYIDLNKKASVVSTMNNFNKTDVNSENNNLTDSNYSQKNPLIVFEVNVRDNENERLEIYEYKNVYKDCDAFCLKFKLLKEKKEYLYKLINDKIQDKSKSSH